MQSGAGSAKEVLNNTLYQPVGDAVRLESNSDNVKLRNNLSWVLFQSIQDAPFSASAPWSRLAKG